MKYQQRPSSCGAAALGNALEAIGISKTQDELEKLSGTTNKGTSANGLLKALRLLGIPRLVMHTRDSRRLLQYTFRQIKNLGNPFILSVDNWKHWVAFVGFLGTKYIIIDSAKEDLVLFLTYDELQARVRPEGKRWSYAIELYPTLFDNVAKN